MNLFKVAYGNDLEDYLFVATNRESPIVINLPLTKSATVPSVILVTKQLYVPVPCLTHKQLFSIELNQYIDFSVENNVKIKYSDGSYNYIDCGRFWVMAPNLTQLANSLVDISDIVVSINLYNNIHIQ